MTVRRLVRALSIVFLIATGLLVALLAAFFVGLALEMRRMQAGDYPLADSSEVTIHGYWLAFPQHTVYLVVEADDIADLQDFLKPGAGRTVCEIVPVSDRPVRTSG